MAEADGGQDEVQPATDSAQRWHLSQRSSWTKQSKNVDQYSSRVTVIVSDHHCSVRLYIECDGHCSQIRLFVYAAGGRCTCPYNTSTIDLVHAYILLFYIDGLCLQCDGHDIEIRQVDPGAFGGSSSQSPKTGC